MKTIKSLAKATVQFGAADIAAVRSALLGSKSAMTALGKAPLVMQAYVGAFLATDKLDAGIALSISGLSGRELLSSQVFAKLSYKCPAFAVGTPFNPFDVELAKVQIMKTIVDTLSDLDKLRKTVRTEKVFNKKEGTSTWRRSEYFNFGLEADADMTRGIHTEPGTVMNKYVHTKAGGIKTKLNGEMKQYCSDVASLPMKLCSDVSEEYLWEYFKQTKWYLAVTNPSKDNKSQEDPILLEERVAGYVSAIMGLQSSDVPLYLSVWFDSRLRMYYDLTLAGIAPHGDAFETNMWELFEPMVISEHGMDAMRHAVVTIATDARHTDANSAKLYTKHSDKYLAIIVDPTHYQNEDGTWKKGGFGEHFYGVRLAQAVADYKSGTPSSFMMGED